jgi:hypothetical protein
VVKTFWIKNRAQCSTLTRLLEEGKYKLPIIEVVGKGFQAIEKGWDKIPQVSGKKFVVSCKN